MKLFFVLFVILTLAACSTSIPLSNNLLVEVKQSKDGRSEASSDNDELTIQFLGNATLAIEGKDSGVLIDGFVTRPGFKQLFFGRIKSINTIVAPVLCEANIGKNIHTIIPLHSHFDHIMDAPYVAQTLEACIVADASAETIMEDWTSVNVCPSKPGNEDRYLSGGFDIEVFDAIHSDTGPGKLVAPLTPGAEVAEEIDFKEKQRAKEYKEGRSLNVFITHSSGVQIFIIGGMFTKQNTESIKKFNAADIVFIAVPLLDKSKNKKFYELVDINLNRTNIADSRKPKKVVVPIHWDQLTRSLPADPEACSTDISSMSEHLKGIPRGGRLKANNLIRGAIKDTQALVKNSKDQGFELRWITAYDRLLIKDRRALEQN